MCFETEDGDGDKYEEDRQRRDHLHNDNETTMPITTINPSATIIIWLSLSTARRESGGLMFCSCPFFFLIIRKTPATVQQRPGNNIGGLVLGWTWNFTQTFHPCTPPLTSTWVKKCEIWPRFSIAVALTRYGFETKQLVGNLKHPRVAAMTDLRFNSGNCGRSSLTFELY